MTRCRWHPVPSGALACRAPDSTRKDCVAPGQTTILRETSPTTQGGGAPERHRRPNEVAPASADRTPDRGNRPAAILRQGADIGPASGAGRKRSAVVGAVAEIAVRVIAQPVMG